MLVDLIITTVAVVALLSTAVVYGTDVFCAVVMRPALASVDDRSLVAVMGSVHRYGDQRMPVPGVLGLVAALVGAVLAAATAHWAQAVAAGVAVVLLGAWVLVYARVSAPINRRLTAAATAGDTPDDARELQSGWDRVINARAALQGLAVAALCVVLVA